MCVPKHVPNGGPWLACLAPPDERVLTELRNDGWAARDSSKRVQLAERTWAAQIGFAHGSKPARERERASGQLADQRPLRDKLLAVAAGRAEQYHAAVERWKTKEKVKEQLRRDEASVLDAGVEALRAVRSARIADVKKAQVLADSDAGVVRQIKVLEAGLAEARKRAVHYARCAALVPEGYREVYAAPISALQQDQVRLTAEIDSLRGSRCPGEAGALRDDMGAQARVRDAKAAVLVAELALAAKLRSESALRGEHARARHAHASASVLVRPSVEELRTLFRTPPPVA